VILLVDANALLWALAADARLGSDAQSALADPTNDVVVSAASVWEIAIKRALGKLDPPDAIVSGIERLGFGTLPVTAADGERAGALPPHHRDPFDRILVAQALRLDATIVSSDRAFDAYGVNRLPA
jgi:PIN domain nuclease of toxin-antitoxin system